MSFADASRHRARVGVVGSGVALGRVAVVAGPVGAGIFVVATGLHPGHDPGDLAVTLPEYAADHYWLAVHLAQLAGVLLLGVVLIALACWLVEAGGWAAALARLGLVTTVASLAVYTVNQAIDGVGIKFVADSYRDAAPADKPGALRLADAIRHLELGTSSLFELMLGLTLVLLGLATCCTPGCPIWLGGLAIGAGIGWTVLGLLLASRGFSVSVTPPAMAVTYLTGLWIAAQAVLLWRWTGRQPARDTMTAAPSEPC
jgi:hypothetical protein